MEVLFGASGRIDRAKYWRSVVVYIGAGLMTAVILFAAAGIAAPLFIILVILVLAPWLPWGLSFTTKRLHDRDKSAWWLVMFYFVPGVLGQLAEVAWFGGVPGTVLYSDAGRSCFDDLGICRNRLPARHRRIEHLWAGPSRASQTTRLKGTAKNEKKPGGRQATGRMLQYRKYVTHLPYPARGIVQIIAAFLSRQATSSLSERWRYLARQAKRHQLTSAAATVPNTPASASAAIRASS